MIPDGWNTQKLEEVSIGILDCHHSTPEWTDSGYIVLRTNNIRNGVLDFSSVSFTNELNYHERVKRAIPEEGDIVVTREAPAGEVALIPPNLKVCLGQRLVLVKLKHNLVSASYIKFYLMSDLVQRNVFQLQANGSTVGNIRIPVLKSINLLLPPLLEQCRIAEMLGVWDESIDLLERLIGRVRSRKQGLMQQLLTGKKRFKEFEGSEYSMVKLSEVAKIRRGASPRPIQDPKWFAEKGRGWVRIRDVTASNTYLMETTQYLSELAVEKSVKVDPGDLIMSICATIGVPRIVGIPACIHDGFVVFREFEKYIDKFFLYHYINLISAKISDSGQPGTQKNINTTIVGNIEVPKFSLPEQEKISAVLSAADEEISTLEKQLAAYKQQKLGLMQQLLTGRIRI
jgi:type I restriction enzyme, S subunit